MSTGIQVLFPDLSNNQTLLILLSSIFYPWEQNPFIASAFLHLFCMSWCFRSSFLFLCHLISIVFFYTNEVATPFRSTPSSSHQMSFRLGTGYVIHLTCRPRGAVGERMEQKSRFKFLLWPGFEPRTSHLSV